MSGSDDERMYQNAIGILPEYDVVSVSTMQRRFAIGYLRASQLIERLERDGHITMVGGSPKYTVDKKARSK